MDERPTVGSLFSGIGGMDLGLERAGFDVSWQVEWDAWCQRVLAKHWPDVPRLGDIHDVHGAAACPHRDATGNDGRERDEGVGRDTGEAGTPSCPSCLPSVDLLAGGFPCQPFSNAGKRRGKADDRWLWPEFARLIGVLRPRLVLVENVPGLLAGHGGMGSVLGDLAALGYDAEWDSIPASAVGAPHLRYRVWIVAYPDGQRPRWTTTLGQEGFPWPRPQDTGAEPHGAGDGAVADATGKRPQGPREPLDALRSASSGDRQAAGTFDGGRFDQWRVEPDVGRVAHGVPSRVDRLRGLGNAVVPQVVEVIGRQLREALS